MALLVAETKYGTVVGQPTTYQASSVFKGIPYAAAPVGDLRWRAPQAPESWSEPLEAFSYGPIPIQRRLPEGDFYRKEFYPIEWPNSEDCLYMNVITPAESADEKLPVALWVYGGGFVQGYSQKIETDGEAFAKRGVIYVSFNYRVGPFGFLSCPTFDAETEQGASGNWGLLDQIAAIDWVRENIAAFGGDPDRITIFGQSAGAMSVYNLLCSPLTKGKIAGAIMESGGGPIPEMLDEAGMRQRNEAFLEFLGTKDTAALRALPAHEIHEKWIDFSSTAAANALLFHPVWDGYALPNDIVESFRAGEFADVPCIIGSMAEEDRSYGDGSEYGPTHMRDGFLGGALAFCDRQAEPDRAPVYIYHMTNVPPGEPCRGAFHSGEHAYIFQTLLRLWRPYTGADLDLSEIMCSFWTNFVKTGNPNAEGLPSWEPYTTAGQAMRFDRAVPRAMFDIPAYNGEARRKADAALGK